MPELPSNMPFFKKAFRNGTGSLLTWFPQSRAFKRKFVQIRPAHHLLLVFFCLATAVLFIFRPFRESTIPRARIPTPIGHTSGGSPLLALPRPYGVAAPVMDSVLQRVHQLVYGGSKVDHTLLRATIDPDHKHGRLIGHYPTSRQPVWTPSPFNFSLETEEMKREAHTKTCYNRRRSNALPLDRPVPDIRGEKCLTAWYYKGGASRSSKSEGFLHRFLGRVGMATTSQDPLLPNTSVIFVFYNEPISALLRAVHSVLDRTPPEMLHEIILVDDGSDSEAPWLSEGGEFEQNLQFLPKTRLARCRGRNGLMRARNIGASIATGQTITFLDSHIEVNAGWIEPLMGRIAEGWQKGVEHVVVPVIDTIDADTFNYTRGGIDILGHTWGLGQTGIPNHFDMDDSSPKQSPIMAGGLLSLSREFFDKLGFYDPEMELWGGEEMEISFRIWLCGGTLECMPCSHVGHVFRSSKHWQGQVYKVPGEVIARNKLRASYWMQEYGELVKLSAAPLEKGKGLGSMKHYEDIRDRLQCKPYRWYLENVYPSMVSSADKLMGGGSRAGRGFVGSGYVRNVATSTCLDSLHMKEDGSVYGVYPCHYQRGSQSTLMTRSKLVLQGELLLKGCLTRGDESKLFKQECKDERESRQTWTIERIERDADGEEVSRMKGEGKCLTVVVEEEVEQKSPFSLRMKECGGELALNQEWQWETMKWDEV